MPPMRIQTPESAQYVRQLRENDKVRFSDGNAEHLYLGKEQLGQQAHLHFARRNNSGKTCITVKYIPEKNLQVIGESLALIDERNIVYRYSYPDIGNPQHRANYFAIDSLLKEAGL